LPASNSSVKHGAPSCMDGSTCRPSLSSSPGRDRLAAAAASAARRVAWSRTLRCHPWRDASSARKFSSVTRRIASACAWPRNSDDGLKEEMAGWWLRVLPALAEGAEGTFWRRCAGDPAVSVRQLGAGAPAQRASSLVVSAAKKREEGERKGESGSGMGG
jgi:hypothetical protein